MFFVCCQEYIIFHTTLMNELKSTYGLTLKSHELFQTILCEDKKFDKLNISRYIFFFKISIKVTKDLSNLFSELLSFCFLFKFRLMRKLVLQYLKVSLVYKGAVRISRNYFIHVIRTFLVPQMCHSIIEKMIINLALSYGRIGVDKISQCINRQQKNILCFQDHRVIQTRTYN